MRIARNPFIDEGARIYFSHGPILRTYLFVPLALAILTFIWWPRSPFSFYVRTAISPQTFTFIAVGMFVCLAYLSARYGAEDYSSDQYFRLREYVTLTPVPLGLVVAGKLGFGIFHSLFLLLLGAPFGLASLAVSGIAPVTAARALLVIGSSALACRMVGFFLLTLMHERQLLRDFIMMVGGILYVVLSISSFPKGNAISAILSLTSLEAGLPTTARMFGAAIPFYMYSVLMSAMVVAVLSAGVLVTLALERRRARLKG